MNSPSIDLDVIRRCMLRGSITAELDMLVTATPVGRCMIIAKALHKASGSCAFVEDFVNESGIMAALKQEALFRQTGALHSAPLTVSDKVSHQNQKEAYFV